MDEKKLIAFLTFIAEDLQEDSWNRLEHLRKKTAEDADYKWADYTQGVVHGIDEGAQKIYRYIEMIKNQEIDLNSF